MAVRNDGDGVLDGWTVGLTLTPGRCTGSLRNGRDTGTGGAVTVRDSDEDGSVAPGSTTAFGSMATGGSPTAPHTLTCAGP